MGAKQAGGSERTEWNAQMGDGEGGGAGSGEDGGRVEVGMHGRAVGGLVGQGGG